MPIHRMLANHAFGPDEITVLTSAFDDALRRLRLADRTDPATEVVVKKIIELAQRGERDDETPLGGPSVMLVQDQPRC
jgi:hypothetical protein